MDVKEQRWPAFDASTGEVVAYHVRIDLEDGNKRFWWEDTEGNKICLMASRSPTSACTE